MGVVAPSDLRYTYRYTALPAGQNAIRLLELFPASAYSDRLQGRLSEVTDWATQSCKYTALSYECGLPERVDTIFIGDYFLGITRNLSVFLRNIRHSTEPLLLWVDAICINQANDDGGKEMSEQIQKMSQIYTHAHEVIGWIGDRTAIAPAALGYLRLFSQIIGQSDHIPLLTAWLEGYVDGTSVVQSNPDNAPLCFEDVIGQEIGQRLSRGTQQERPSLKIMFEFMNIKYWSRLWCVQEAVLNTNFSFRYGPSPEHSLKIAEMEPFQALMIVALRLPRVLDNPNYYQCEGMYDKMICMWTLGSVIRNRYPLPLSDFQQFYTCLYANMGPDATQPNDYIYGLLGLFQQSPVEVDTSMNPRDLYLKVLETTQHQSKTLDFLSISCANSFDNLLTQVNNKHNLPHWAVDYSHRETSARCLLMWDTRFEVPLKTRFKASYQKRASFRTGQTGQQVTFDFANNMFRAAGIIFSKICDVGSTHFSRDYENKTKQDLPKGFEPRLWPDDWSEVAQLGKLKGPPVLFSKPSQKLGPDADAWHTGISLFKLFIHESLSSKLKRHDRESKLGTFWTLMFLDTAMNPNTRIRDDPGDYAYHYIPPKSRKEMEQLIDGRRMRQSGRLDRRKLFRTESGHLGLGAPRTEVGDLVVVLYGGYVPYIFRPSPVVQGGYMFVCDCIVQGIMDGQAMSLEREQVMFDVYG